jgi:hypothetical protein
MAEFGPRHFLLAGFAVVVGLVVGGLGPRSELRDLRERLADADARACDRPVGSDIASVFRGRPWEPPRDDVPTDDAAAPAPADPPDEGGHVEITIGDDVDDAPPEESMDAMRDAMELRRTQSVAALREQARASDAQMASVEAITEDMNRELHSLATDFVETVTEAGGEPGRHDMMVFAADTLDVLLAAEEQLYGTLDEDQRAAVDEEATDPLSFVDGRILEVLAELDSR